MERTLIAPGVHLSCDPAEKFNRCRISIHFAFPAQRATATAHALLPLVLERGYADCPEKGFVTACGSIPGWIEITDQSSKFILLSGIIIIIQWLYKGFIEFLRQFFSENFCAKFLPEKPKCRIRYAVLTDSAVFLVMVISAATDIKYDTVKIIWHTVATYDRDLWV